MSISFKIKVLLQDLKKCKHWFSYCSNSLLNDYAKEICAKQVANQSDFLKAFLHLEPLLYLEIPQSKSRHISESGLPFGAMKSESLTHLHRGIGHYD